MQAGMQCIRSTELSLQLNTLQLFGAIEYGSILQVVGDLHCPPRMLPLLLYKAVFYYGLYIFAFAEIRYYAIRCQTFLLLAKGPLQVCEAFQNHGNTAQDSFVEFELQPKNCWC